MKTAHRNHSTILVLAVTILCCLVMAWVDGVLRPGYAVKSAIKAAMFLLIPLIASRVDRDVQYLSFLRPKKKGLLPALALGAGVYAVILGGYFLVSPFFDFSQIAGALTENVGVTRQNFLFVSLYISFANSFLEEFFFRGFVFTNLKQHSGRGLAYLFSAAAFSLYHVAMMIGWFSPVLFLLVMVGLLVGGMLFNYLNEKLDTIYCSWLTHMFANFAINTIGFMLLR
ncbi:MAG: CPBP family intramembrane metalloprotease [Ruminococcaceae bacterium]|nr:CPBP family intramembrane metalloprotease [Oscillospiraceae bacterium]